MKEDIFRDQFGKFHGRGTYTFGNRETHIGEQKDGKPRGKGTRTYDGEMKEGIWRNGRLWYYQKTPPTVTAKKTSTYNSEHLKRIKETNNCFDCDLRGANLSGANLSHARLWNADLKGANLSSAKSGYQELES